MKAYQWVVFDADDTLFHFDSYTGLKQLFLRYNCILSLDEYDAYQIKNKKLWQEYQSGLITAHDLKIKRFEDWSEKLNVTAHDLNQGFLEEMHAICKPLEGAETLLNFLKEKTKLAIITNGFTALQEARLEKTNFKKYFDLLVISEQVGVPKPHPQIFDHALSHMKNIEPHNVLMVGDNPETDIVGGYNAGFDTCWLNVHNKSLPSHINTHFEVNSLHELKNLLEKSFNTL